MIKPIISFFSETKWRYKLCHSDVRIRKGSCFTIGDAKIVHSAIFVENGSLMIEDGCELNHISLYVKNGHVRISKHTLLKGVPQMSITIEDGSMVIGHHSKLNCKRIWIRFGGKLAIGDYTNINEGSEIRSDEAISIGSYNQISFNVKIWDTNTHTIYPAEERRELTERFWPFYGKELERPKTNPVVVGDDCWLGENVAILKGTSLGNGVIVGFGTTIAGRAIENGKTVVRNLDLNIL